MPESEPLIRWHNNFAYPYYLEQNNAAEFILPVATKICRGKGLDVGAGDNPFPNAEFVCDSKRPEPWNDALNLPLPDESLDYVFSSHCLEHIVPYFSALGEWIRVLKKGGILFLYLPHHTCEIWKVGRHVDHWHVFRVEDIKSDLTTLGVEPKFNSDRDLAYGFAVWGIKQ